MMEEWCGFKGFGLLEQMTTPYRVTMGDGGGIINICLYGTFSDLDEEALISTIKDALEFRRNKK